MLLLFLNYFSLTLLLSSNDFGYIIVIRERGRLTVFGCGVNFKFVIFIFIILIRQRAKI